ncbi:hypothetical protein TorRG33x02_197360 [Trema orientale]|uniref:Putative plant transposon protein domain-containing protein n=1 Tax=Trema orientale TaxID=63057 RepID=A0A2P5EG61_TREOI|nr:hypothetical protein TorRG33x02_197360 [Trema orientale]
MAPRRENPRQKGKEIRPEEHEQTTKVRLDILFLESPTLMTSFQPKPRVIDLTLEARILFQFVSQNMIPRAGHRDAPTFGDIHFVDSILVGRKLDLPFFILYEMINAIENRRSSLPYGFLLTRIFQHFNIPTIDEAEHKPWSIDVEINNKTFSLIGFTFINKTRQAYEQETGAQQVAGGSSARATEGAPEETHAAEAPAP